MIVMVLFKTLQVILALSILILIHEFGHFFFARVNGIRVDKFFLFFDLGGVKLFSTRQKWFLKLFPAAKDWETEFGIGWFPLGGYCKISGMVDESMDLEQLKQDPKPWEFRTHPSWQRLLVMVGGVLNNFIFAIMCYIAIVCIWGETYLKNEGSAIYASELAQEMGFRTGDRILSLDDYVPEDFSMLQADLARRNVQNAKVLRDGDTLDIYIDHSYMGKILNSPLMFDVALPFVVDSVMAEGPNGASGLARGDRIIAFDSLSCEYRQDAYRILSESRGKTLDAKVLRGSDTLSVPVRIDSSGKMGIYLPQPDNICHKEYSLLAAIPAGIRLTGENISGYLKDLRLVFQPSSGAYKSVGSFISIGQVFPSHWNWYSFINILALLSIMLGVMNLIPIPGLDGGHIVFTLYEMITGRKPSEKFLAGAQIMGFILLMALMILAFGNDISRLIHG